MGKVYWKITNSAWFGDKILRDALVLFRGMNTARNGLYFFKATISDKQMVIFVLRVCYVSFGRQAMKPWLLDSDTVQVPASGPGGSSPRWRDCSHAWRLAVFSWGLDGLRYVSYIPFKVKLEADQQTSFIQLQNQSLGLYHAQIPARAPDSSRVPVASVFREFFRRWVTSRLRLEYKFNWVQDSCELHAA